MAFTFTQEQIDAAIEAEIADLNRWSDPGEPARDYTKWREQRRAQVAAGKWEALKRYLLPNHVPVAAYRMDEAIDALTKLARKAERYGTPAVKWTLGEPYFVQHETSYGHKYKVGMIDFVFESLEAPRVGKYQFIAKIERTAGGNIIACIPGEELPESYREGSGECQHCQQKRDRRNLFVVRSEDGELTQVGQSCLRDFMGTDTPASVAARFRFISELESLGEEYGPRMVRVDSALEMLAVTAAAIRLWGWVPKSAPESAGLPTALRIAPWFSPVASLSKYEVEDRKALNEAMTEADWALAQTVLDWVEASEDKSEYMWNLKTILRPGMVEAKRRGYAASAVAAYQRHLGKLEVRRRESEAAAGSEWIGVVGERLKGLRVRCVSARGIDTVYGGSVVYKFHDVNGNVLTWFSSGGADLDPGSDYELDATIKAHSEYQGVKETQLTRGKVK